ncbi:MAG: MBL fold metallo-hydrolase [Casimicrobiaceae bacterium]
MGHTAHPDVQPFFHAESGTFSYVVHAGQGSGAVIIDPVLDFDAASGQVGGQGVDALLHFVKAQRLRVHWILETHAHADHMTAARTLRTLLGARVAIGRGIVDVQACLQPMLAMADGFVPDGSQFDRLLDDGDNVEAGELVVRVLATPGHTADGHTYLVGDAAFVGDTLFAPDVGTARCDFPGGDAATLYRSIQRILALPASTRMFLCHDYPPPRSRDPLAQTSVSTQRDKNMHVGGGVLEEDFVGMRKAKDATLKPPRLMQPALRVNLDGGQLPPADADGVTYSTLRIDVQNAP